MDSYFIITSGEDGTRVDGPMTHSEVLERVQPRADGHCGYGEVEFLAAVPDSDKGCWIVDAPEHVTPLLIIKGHVVVPATVAVTTRLALE